MSKSMPIQIRCCETCKQIVCDQVGCFLHTFRPNSCSLSYRFWNLRAFLSRASVSALRLGTDIPTYPPGRYPSSPFLVRILVIGFKSESTVTDSPQPTAPTLTPTFWSIRSTAGFGVSQSSTSPLNHVLSESLQLTTVDFASGCLLAVCFVCEVAVGFADWHMAGTLMQTSNTTKTILRSMSQRTLT